MTLFRILCVMLNICDYEICVLLNELMVHSFMTFVYCRRKSYISINAHNRSAVGAVENFSGTVAPTFCVHQGVD